MKAARTSTRRVRSYVETYEAVFGVDSTIATTGTADGDASLTTTDLRAVLALAGLASHVIEHLYMELDDEGDLTPSAYRGLAEDVATWREMERAWTWYAADAPAMLARLRQRAQNGGAR